MEDTQLMWASNVLGVSVVVLIIAYHYVTADSKKNKVMIPAAHLLPDLPLTPVRLLPQD